jgi:hypothetical protein
VAGAGIVRVSGGIGRSGGLLNGAPSPTGEWDPRLNDQTVDFDRDEFTRFIADKGYNVLWEKAVPCPNVPGTGLSPRDHVIGCPVCLEEGYVFVDPCNTHMLMQGIKLTQSFYAYGRWDSGSMMVTAEPGMILDYWDRFTLQNGVARFSERIVRQPNITNDITKYSPLCIDYVAWVDHNTQLVVFQSGTDFIMSPDGSGITWQTANQPDAMSFYSVMYNYRPRYVVTDIVHHHRDSTIDGKHYMFPVQAVAKLDFLVRNQSADPPIVVDKSPFQ